MDESENHAPANVLLVDDRQDKMLALEAVLESLPCRILKAGSGKEALRLILDYEISVILMDVNMPGMDGFETARLIRQRPANEKTPIIFITSVHHSEGHIFKGYSFGAVDYILTPIIPEVLKTKVRVLIDLQQRNRQLEEQARWLKESRERLELAMRASETDAWSWEISGDHLTWNGCPLNPPGDAFEGSMHEMISLIHPEDRNRVIQAIDEGLHGKDQVDFEFRLPLPDGNMMFFSARARVMQDAAGNPSKVVGVMLNTTARQISEQARQEAEEASRAKDRFLAILSHELRTPLSPVLMALSVLRKESQLSSHSRQCLELIERNINLEARLIDDLLDLSRIVHNKVEFNFSAVDLHKAIGDAVETCRPEISSKNHELSLELGSTHSLVWGDGVRLQQVFWNLIKNGVKFTPPGGALCIRTTEARGQIQVQIRDNGVGITGDFQRIFEPFEQAENHTGSGAGGLGLGLAISNAIIKAHDGKIRAESEGANRGSLFTVELPLYTLKTGVNHRRKASARGVAAAEPAHNGSN